ncbi:unnamed protein product, partial [Closterium sp. NIES-53]
FGAALERAKPVWPWSGPSLLRHCIRHWEWVVRHYVDGLGINWEGVRNVVDMDAHYGGRVDGGEWVRVVELLHPRGTAWGTAWDGREYQHDVGHWERVVRYYMDGLGINWGGGVRNVLDMDAHYGGFGAGLERAKPVWAMNVVPTTHPDTLPVVFERGLLGVFHDCCELFITYPRTDDLVHSDHHFGKVLTEKRCEVADIAVKIDRILHPFGYLIAREHAQHIPFLQAVARGLGWSQTVLVKEGREVFVVFYKTMWRPEGQAEQQQQH